VLLKLGEQLLSNVNGINTLVLFALEHVVVDEVRLVHVFLKLVEHLLGCLGPRVGILEETLGNSSNLDDLFFDMPEVLLENCLRDLFLNL